MLEKAEALKSEEVSVEYVYGGLALGKVIDITKAEEVQPGMHGDVASALADWFMHVWVPWCDGVREGSSLVVCLLVDGNTTQCGNMKVSQAASFTAWAQQLASIIPLLALIEFVDVASKLHIYELTGSVPLWGWPVTPAGARLLLSTTDSEESCTLDNPGRGTALECLDGRHGDRYSSSTPSTTRLWCSAMSDVRRLENKHENLGQPGSRPQYLEVVHLVDRVKFPGPVTTNKTAQPRTRVGDLLDIMRSSMPKYVALSVFGWSAWVTLLLFTCMGSLWFASAYLMTIPCTGLIIHNIYGGKPRELLNGNDRGKHNRVIIAASSLNSSSWWAFYGESMSINSLLNRPIRRRGATRWPRVSRLLLQVCILGQWILVVASSALVDWNAIIISIWIFFCALSSSRLYPADIATRDWLWYRCRIKATRFQIPFSSRRAMLGALLCISPDSMEGRTAWVDHVLSASSPDRQAWETALLEYIRQSDRSQLVPSKDYWWKWIPEGVEVGELIKVELGKN